MKCLLDFGGVLWNLEEFSGLVWLDEFGRLTCPKRQDLS